MLETKIPRESGVFLFLREIAKILFVSLDLPLRPGLTLLRALPTRLSESPTRRVEFPKRSTARLTFLHIWKFGELFSLFH
jgi:hypothetical protein